jgi:hypothetical protein
VSTQVPLEIAALHAAITISSDSLSAPGCVLACSP